MPRTLAELRDKLASASDDDGVPVWLNVMRAISGTEEVPGDGDNPKIVGMAQVIARVYPEMQSYCDQYQHDSTAWCGLTEAFCVTVAGYRPPFGATDTDKFLWAQSFASDPGFVEVAPRVGAIVVMTREGGGHVTTLEEIGSGQIFCRGGNQSDAINAQWYDDDAVIGYYWPKGAPLPPAPRRNLEEGDSGADVVEVQTILSIPADGEFGPTTEGAVKGFQSGAGLDVDGEVGPATWAELDDVDARRKEGYLWLSPDEHEAVVAIARGSPVCQYSWPDRGRSPVGYVVGMALTYAAAVRRLADGDEAVTEMAQADRQDDDEDVFSWFSDELDELEWPTSRDGVDSLRTLFAIMIGLGMRESSGRYCEGRDQSASNTTADTAEASLFQTSWNIRSCCDEIGPLLNEFWLNPNGFVEDFREGVSPNGSELQNYGAGSDGAKYQFLSKYAPAFHAYVTAIGLRYLRQHWGPVNRSEVTLLDEAYELLAEVEAALSGDAPVPPEPSPDEAPTADVSVVASGEVDASVNDLDLVTAGIGPAKIMIDVTTEGGDVEVDVQVNGTKRR